MLISPIRIHDLLESILEPSDGDGPHTALLITPQGRLLAHATLPEGSDGEDDGDEGDADGEGDEDEDGDCDADGDGDADGEIQEESDEPWLEGPERLRLLLGLASQWEEDESPRVECELGRLLLTPIALPEPEVPPPNAAMPAIRAQTVSSFVLVLNGTAGTPWNQLAQKADTFLAKW